MLSKINNILSHPIDQNPVLKRQDFDFSNTVLTQPINNTSVSTANFNQNSTKRKTGVRYLISDWDSSRERMSIENTGKVSAVQGIAKSASIGGVAGSIVPVIGTGVGSAIGAVVGGISALFGGSKDKRLIQHIEEFYILLAGESFGESSFSVGLGSTDGNGGNAPILKDQYPKNEMEAFLLNAGNQFLQMVEDGGTASSKDQRAIQGIKRSLRFSDRLPARGESAVYIAYKIDPVTVTVDESGKISQSGNAQKAGQKTANKTKITGGIAVAILSLILSK